MIPKEKVIKRIQTQISVCKEIDSDWISLTVSTGKRILELLEEQEPIVPTLVREGQNKYYNYYRCPICDEDLYYEQKYCSECGKAVKWD